MNGGKENPSWTLTARLLHWSMAILILLQAGLGWYAESLDRSPLRIDLMTAHKSLGISLLLLVIMRLAWRWRHPPPPPLPEPPRHARLLARWVQGLMYFLMFSIPLSGWLAASTAVFPWKLWWLLPWPRLTAPDAAVQDLAAGIHEWLIWSLTALLVLHIAAAIKNHLLDRDDTLRSMWRV